jgi:maltooligosyltrehalose trehalohydrolase
VDPFAIDWRDDSWKGRSWEEAALYELHVGTFGPDGKFDGVKKRLGHLADLGVTAIELMPLSGSPGRRHCQLAPCSTVFPWPC